MIRNSAISLYQLLGAPLRAIVDAETHSALATADFIERVGFEKSGDETDSKDFGKLRMITFLHERKGQDGNKETIKIEIPLLSLIPIPALQIKEAELDFNIVIIDELKITKESTLLGNSALPSGDHNPDHKNLFIKAITGESPRQLKGTFAPGNSQSSKSNSLQAEIKVKIKMEQSDIPAGLGKLFHIMEQNVGVTKKED